MKSIKHVSPEGVIVYRNEHGYLHRENGPALIWPSGYKAWFINGEKHREDGPAEVYPSGYKAWYINGKFHREDGPAVIRPDGSKHYWLNGKRYSYGDWFDRVTNPIMYKWREFCGIN